MKLAAKIIKGALSRLTRKDGKAKYRPLSFFQEKLLKHQDDTSIKKIDLKAFHLHYQHPWEVLHTYDEIFVREIYRFSTSDPNPIIIDCGSNIGQSVLYYKLEYPNSKVIAFEADKHVFSILQKNIAENGLINVEANEAAVWTNNGTIRFSSKGTEASHISDTGEGVEVRTIRLKDVIEKHEKVDLLKIDIEGAEYHVMLDIEPVLHKVKHLFLEYHGTFRENPKLTELLTLLNNNGFNYYIRNAADLIRYPFEHTSHELPYDLQLNIFCNNQRYQ